MSNGKLSFIGKKKLLFSRIFVTIFFYPYYTQIYQFLQLAEYNNRNNEANSLSVVDYYFGVLYVKLIKTAAMQALKVNQP